MCAQNHALACAKEQHRVAGEADSAAGLHDSHNHRAGSGKALLTHSLSITLGCLHGEESKWQKDDVYGGCTACFSLCRATRQGPLASFDLSRTRARTHTHKAAAMITYDTSFWGLPLLFRAFGSAFPRATLFGALAGGATALLYFLGPDAATKTLS